MNSPTFASNATGVSHLVGPLWIVASLLLFSAWWMPLLESSHLLQWSPDQLSILDGLVRLYSDSEYFLAGVILVFAILLPFAKSLVSLFVWYFLDPKDPKTNVLISVLGHLGKWAMLDVFLIALSVIFVKGIPGTEITASYGLYVFFSALMLSMVASTIMLRICEKLKT